MAVRKEWRKSRPIEVHREEDPSGSVVARLSIEGAECWLSDEAPEYDAFSPESLCVGTVRMVLTVPDPDALFARALAASVLAVFGVRLHFNSIASACHAAIDCMNKDTVRRCHKTKDTLRLYHKTNYSPQVEGAKLPSEDCWGNFKRPLQFFGQRELAIYFVQKK